jgi:hypothetical protein
MKPLLSMILLFCFSAPPGFSVGEPQQQQIPGMRQEAPEDRDRAKLEREMEKKRNQQRHADLKRDTDQLLKLATQLKEYVDKSNENVLSLDVVKKAEEIEKLAHSVKDKMKGD